jgi:hypothetical protein
MTPSRDARPRVPRPDERADGSRWVARIRDDDDGRRSTFDVSTVDATLVSTLDAPLDARARLAKRRRRDARVIGRAHPRASCMTTTTGHDS